MNFQLIKLQGILFKVLVNVFLRVLGVIREMWDENYFKSKVKVFYHEN